MEMVGDGMVMGLGNGWDAYGDAMKAAVNSDPWDVEER